MRFRHLVLAGMLVTAAPAVLAAAPRYGTWGAATEDMDLKVKPGDSLFDYAEGTWLKSHPIPADKTGAGYNYELPDEIEQQVRKMVEDVTANPSSSIAKKIGDAYAAWMDEAGIAQRGLAPLKPWLARSRWRTVMMEASPEVGRTVSAGKRTASAFSTNVSPSAA